jgi:uroporphyrinogen decarboxylase
MMDRATLLKTVRFERPDYIPMTFHINPSCWHHYPKEQLLELMADHALLFPDFSEENWQEPEIPPFADATRQFTDPWGCVWETADSGIIGAVVHHALGSWDDFEEYQPPDPNKTTHWAPIDWEKEEESPNPVGFFTSLHSGEIGHGHTFLRLIDLRGYQNLLYDMIDEEPRLRQLIEMVEEFNLGLVRNYLDRLGVEWLGYAEDLGMQRGPMLSPDQFRTYIKPSYKRIIKPAKERGAVIHMHADGDLKLLMEDILETGVDVINLQDLVNGIDWIEEHLKGKVCIDLDIDRQEITHHGTTNAIDSLIREEIERLGTKKGGLMMIYGLYPGVPLENVKALMDAMERYTDYYS